MYSLINFQKYVDVTLCGISSLGHFENLNFEKILNQKAFKSYLYEMKQNEEIKNIL